MHRAAVRIELYDLSAIEMDDVVNVGTCRAAPAAARQRGGASVGSALRLNTVVAPLSVSSVAVHGGPSAQTAARPPKRRHKNNPIMAYNENCKNRYTTLRS